MSVDDPTVFLRARLDEVAAAAKAATPGPWSARPVIYGPPEDGWGDPENGPWEVEAGEGRGDVVSHQMHEGGGADGPDARHIARHDPARVLREVEANRSLLAAFEEISQPDPGDSPQERANRMVTAEVVRMLVLDRARVYSDHPDFRQEWKP